MAIPSFFSSVIWASVQRFGTMIISFVANMVLARLLTPTDFGTVGMLLFFLTLATTFVDSGFGAALIQKNNLTERDKSTVFYVNMTMSIILYGILFILAPFIANFYNVEELCILLRVEGLVLIINAFGLIQTTLMKKNLDFKTLSKCNIIGSLVGSFICITFAFLGFGVWSLIIRVVITSVVTSIMLWIEGKWNPSESFSLHSFKELFGYGGFMLLSSILFTITNNIQTLIIGKAFKPAILGNYTQANTLKNYMSDSFSSIIGQVEFPDFSNHQDNLDIMKNRLLIGVDVLSFITCSILSLCILIAEPLIRILYGEQWNVAIPYFQILCVGGVALSVQDINYHMVAAKGKSGMLFLLNVGKTVIFLLLLYLSSKYLDIIGVLWSIVVYNFLAYFAFAFASSFCLRMNPITQCFIMVRNLIVVSIPTIILMLLNSCFFQTGTFLMLIVDVLFYLCILFVISKLLKMRATIYVYNNIIKVFKYR